MGNINFIENVATRLGQSASVKNVYGDPVTANGKTIIPVAQIAFGFGGGFGQMKKPSSESLGEVEQGEKEKDGEGAGGGGGMYARAKGVYEITDQQTRFIPVNNNSQLLAAAFFGFLIGRFFFRKRK